MLSFDFFELLSSSPALLIETDEVNLGRGGGGGVLLEARGGIEEVFLRQGDGSRLFREGGALPSDGGLSNWFENGSDIPSSSLKEHLLVSLTPGP